MHNQTVIGLMGFKGSGKDTVANLLSEFGRDFTAVSFAHNVKKVLCIIFGWQMHMLEGHTKQSREWRDQVDPWWAEKLNIPDFTPRKAMTMVGTDTFRKHFNDNIWILSLVNEIRQTNNNIVITDIRFINEYHYVKTLTDHIFRVHREDAPWEKIGVLASQGDPSAILYMETYGIHRSEWEWLSCPYADFIVNSKDLPHLINEIENKIISKL